jgi:uncharacterized membrane protein
MKALITFLKTTLVGGLVIVLPVWVSILLVLKSLGAATIVVHPIATQLPEKARHPQLLAAALLLAACFAAGLLIRTAIGRQVKSAMERSVLNRVPGYSVLRGLAERLDNTNQAAGFAPALVEIEEALAPAFIVERHADGRVTVFVPSAPTPAVGAIYIMTPERVHEVDVSLVKAVSCISKWGSGSSELLNAMRPATLARSADAAALNP